MTHCDSYGDCSEEVSDCLLFEMTKGVFEKKQQGNHEDCPA